MYLNLRNTIKISTPLNKDQHVMAHANIDMQELKTLNTR
jgi:hypothetical protein